VSGNESDNYFEACFYDALAIAKRSIGLRDARQGGIAVVDAVRVIDVVYILCDRVDRVVDDRNQDARRTAVYRNVFESAR
jgi:hypothetical protein